MISHNATVVTYGEIAVTPTTNSTTASGYAGLEITLGGQVFWLTDPAARGLIAELTSALGVMKAAEHRAAAVAGDIHDGHLGVPSITERFEAGRQQ